MPRQKPNKLIEAAEKDNLQLKLSKAEVEAAKWKRLHRDATRVGLAYQMQVEALAGMPKKPAIQQFPPPDPFRTRKAKGVAVVVPATDWHVEEQVTLEATNGKNEFNLEIAEDRIKRYYGKILELIEWQNHLAPVKEIWHPLLGDLMSGYIHEELMETNALSPTETCVFLQEMICSGIDHLCKKTKLPIFIPTCVGNHGRTTAKRRIKTSCQNSFEWLLYMTLAKYYAKNKRVHWCVGNGYHNTVQIMGRKVRFHHGDSLHYQGGVGGISIPANKAVAQWDKLGVVDFDIFGHWHTFLWNYSKWVACGSLMGFSEFSLSIKAEFQHPTQTFIVIDHDYGVTMTTPIFVTKAGGE